MSDLHEQLCRRCGRCCRVKLRVDDDVFVFPEVCPHLDPVTHLCRIYHDRHRLNPECADVHRGVRYRTFPADCPYVAGIPDYHAPIEVNSEADVRTWLGHHYPRPARR